MIAVNIFSRTQQGGIREQILMGIGTVGEELKLVDCNLQKNRIAKLNIKYAFEQHENNIPKHLALSC